MQTNASFLYGDEHSAVYYTDWSDRTKIQTFSQNTLFNLARAHLSVRKAADRTLARETEQNNMAALLSLSVSAAQLLFLDLVSY